MSSSGHNLLTPLLHHEVSSMSLDLGPGAGHYRPHATWAALKIDMEGNASPITFDKHDLTKLYNIPNRDLRSVDPEAPLLAPSTIFVRENALIIIIGSLRAIILKDHVLVLSVPGPIDPAGNTAPSICCPKAMQQSAFVVELVGKLKGQSRLSLSMLDACSPAATFEARTNLHTVYSEQRLEASHRGEDDSSRNGMEAVDFEFSVLEMALLMSIKTIEVETSALELGSKQAMASLTDQVSKPALANLMAVKTKAVKMNTRAVRFKEEMERILQDNEEMAEMFLTRRAHMDTVLAEQQGALQSTPSTAEAAAAALAEGPEGRSEGGTQGGFQGGPFAGAALEREPSMHPQASMGSVGSPPSSRGFVRTSTIRRPLRSPTVTPGRGLRSVTMPADGGAVSGKHAGLVLASDELGQMALVQAIGDVEDMLEYYYMLVQSVCSRIAAVRERIASLEASVQIEQDHRRNELVALELMVNSVTMAFALISMIAGIFGMNLASGWETSQIAFWSVCAISCVLGLFICASVVMYARAKRLLFISSMLESRMGP